MPIEASFHFTQQSGDDYIIDALPYFRIVTVADLSELGNLMGGRTGGDPIVVVARFWYLCPKGILLTKMFTNAYFIGDRGSYVAVNVIENHNRPAPPIGVVPLLDFDRDYTLYLEASEA